MAKPVGPGMCEGYLKSPTEAARCETTGGKCSICNQSAEDHSRAILNLWIDTLRDLQSPRCTPVNSPSNPASALSTSMQSLSLSTNTTNSGNTASHTSSVKSQHKGVSLKFLNTFRDEMKTLLGGDKYAEATLYDIKPFVVEKTSQPTHTTYINNKTYKGISYIELMETECPDEIAEATHFISHTWEYLFEDTVQTINEYFENERVFIWLDIFTINQVDSTLVSELITSQGNFGDFLKAPIDAIKSTVLIICKYHPKQEVPVLDSNGVDTGEKKWEFIKEPNGDMKTLGIHAPSPFYRVWCIFEIYHSLLQNKLTIAISNGEWKQLRAHLSDYEWINKMYANINVERSMAGNGTSPTDIEVREKILKILLRGSDGYNKVNIDIIDGIRDLMLKKVEEELAVIDNHKKKTRGISTATRCIILSRHLLLQPFTSQYRIKNGPIEGVIRGPGHHQ